MNNLLINVIKSKNLDKLIIGQEPFFIMDREFGLHWQYASYKKNIEPYIQEILPDIFWEEVINLFKYFKDKNLLLDSFVSLLICYYYTDNTRLLENRTSNTPIEIIDLIKNYLLENKNELINDVRGTGVEWNSQNGLWGGITSNLRIIEKRGGPKNGYQEDIQKTEQLKLS